MRFDRTDRLIELPRGKPGHGQIEKNEINIHGGDEAHRFRSAGDPGDAERMRLKERTQRLRKPGVVLDDQNGFGRRLNHFVRDDDVWFRHGRD